MAYALVLAAVCGAAGIAGALAQHYLPEIPVWPWPVCVGLVPAAGTRRSIPGDLKKRGSTSIS